MKILLLARRFPYPLHNGEDLRIFHFAKHLSRNHELHLAAPDLSETACEALRFFKRLHRLNTSIKHSTYTFASRVVKAFSPEHMYGIDPIIQADLRRIVEHGSFDLLWIPAWSMMPYAHGIGKLPVLFDVMDDGVLELARELRYCRSLLTLPVLLKRLFVTCLFERKYLSRGTRSFVAEIDAAVFDKICRGGKTIVIPNGVDTDYFKPLGLPEEFPSLVFEGNMSFGPTVDAAVYFCQSILPRIAERVPEVKLTIVGKDPVPEVRRLAGERVIVTGFVDDVRPYIDRASIFVCPMRKGAGIKNKLLQAWAMAKPVVATSIALGGLYAKPGENILVADTPAEFSEAVIRLLKNSVLRQALGGAGLEIIRGHYSWDRQGRLLEAALRAL